MDMCRVRLSLFIVRITSSCVVLEWIRDGSISTPTQFSQLEAKILRQFMRVRISVHCRWLPGNERQGNETISAGLSCVTEKKQQ